MSQSFVISSSIDKSHMCGVSQRVVCRNTSAAKSVHVSLGICHTYTLVDDQSQRKSWGTEMRVTKSGVSQRVVCHKETVSNKREFPIPESLA